MKPARLINAETEMELADDDPTGRSYPHVRHWRLTEAMA